MRIDAGLLSSEQLGGPVKDFIPKVDITKYKVYPERIKIRKKRAPEYVYRDDEIGLSPEDKVFVQELVGGVTRWRLRLDDIISKYTKKYSMADIDIVILNALRMGVYEVLEMDLPAIEINKHINLPRAFELPRQARSLINSVLRQIIVLKYGGDLVLKHDFLGGKESFMGTDLASGLSHPQWLVKRWMKRFGPQEAITLMMWNNEAPKYSMRVREGAKERAEKKLGEMGCQFREAEFLKDEFIRIESGIQDIVNSDLVQKGDVFIQDISNGLVVQLLDPQPGERIADISRSSGESPLHISQRLKGDGQVVAISINSLRLQELSDRAQTCGYQDVFSTYEYDIKELYKKDTEQNIDKDNQQGEIQQGDGIDIYKEDKEKINQINQEEVKVTNDEQIENSTCDEANKEVDKDKEAANDKVDASQSPRSSSKPLIEKILERRRAGRGFRYLVKWVDQTDTEWVVGSKLPQNIVQEFNINQEINVEADKVEKEESKMEKVVIEEKSSSIQDEQVGDKKELIDEGKNDDETKTEETVQDSAKKDILSDFSLFDKVLVDAPCSQFGLLSKRAELRWLMSVEVVKRFIVAQRKILQGAAQLVRPGGLLVYSTCTLEPEENQKQISYFLENNSDFEVEIPPKQLLPEAAVTEQGWIYLFPHKYQVDGAFAVRLRRKQNEN